MTRTDWGEGFTYNGPLDGQYFASWSDERLKEMIEWYLADLEDDDENQDSDFQEYMASHLLPMADGLELKGDIDSAKNLREIAQTYISKTAS